MLFGPPAALRSDRLDHHSDFSLVYPQFSFIYDGCSSYVPFLLLQPHTSASFRTPITNEINSHLLSLSLPSLETPKAYLAFRCRKGPRREVNGVGWLIEEEEAGRTGLSVLIPLYSCCLSSVSHFFHFSFFSRSRTQNLASRPTEGTRLAFLGVCCHHHSRGAGIVRVPGHTRVSRCVHGARRSYRTHWHGSHPEPVYMP